jgi:hypothetical protein
MSWLKRWIIKLVLSEIDSELTPLIAAKVRQAQATLNSIPPDDFAKQLVSDIEDAVFKYLGIQKES